MACAVCQEIRVSVERTDVVPKKPKLGSGERFKQLAAKAAAGGAKNPDAVAAAAGMKKYGKKKMTAMAKAGRKRKSK